MILFDFIDALTGAGNVAGLSLFLWQDGFPFDRSMNQYMSATGPAGIDPTISMMLVQNGSYDIDPSISGMKVELSNVSSA